MSMLTFFASMVLMSFVSKSSNISVNSIAISRPVMDDPSFSDAARLEGAPSPSSGADHASATTRESTQRVSLEHAASKQVTR
jgi:flagellar motor protein MotB